MLPYPNLAEESGLDPDNVSVRVRVGVQNWRTYVKKLILIIDDDKLFLDIITLMMYDNNQMIDGYQVNILTARNGKGGIDAIENNISDLDLVFIDVMLPDISGLEIYKHARTLNKELHIALMSGYPLAELSNDPNLHYLHKGQFGLNELELLFEKIF